MTPKGDRRWKAVNKVIDKWIEAHKKEWLEFNQAMGEKRKVLLDPEYGKSKKGKLKALMSYPPPVYRINREGKEVVDDIRELIETIIPEMTDSGKKGLLYHREFARLFDNFRVPEKVKEEDEA